MEKPPILDLFPVDKIPRSALEFYENLPEYLLLQRDDTYQKTLIQFKEWFRKQGCWLACTKRSGVGRLAQTHGEKCPVWLEIEKLAGGER